MFTDTGHGLMKVRVNQTGHCQQKLSFQRAGTMYHHDFLHHSDKFSMPKAIAQT
jgi:hypothetical protein